MKPLITCKEMNEFLVDYIEGALPEAQKTEFHRHLAACPSCVHYVESYKTTIAAGKAAYADAGASATLPPVPEELIRAILAARKKPAK